MKDYGSKRRHPRFEFPELINYCSDNADFRSPVSAVSINISESGLCLYTQESISVGQNVCIRTSQNTPYVKATARWVKKYLDDLYKVGFMFIE